MARSRVGVLRDHNSVEAAMRYLAPLFLLLMLAAGATAAQSSTTASGTLIGTSGGAEKVSDSPSSREAPQEWLQAGACPFECCQYGKWTARRDLTVVASPSDEARVVTRIAPGTVFDAITGQTRTIAGIFRFSRPVGRFGAGDRVWVYDYLGEGHYRAWVGGAMRDIELLPTTPGFEVKAAMGSWEVEPAQTWWVQVRISDGVEGWLDMADPRAVGGNDACGL